MLIRWKLKWKIRPWSFWNCWYLSNSFNEIEVRKRKLKWELVRDWKPSVQWRMPKSNSFINACVYITFTLLGKKITKNYVFPKRHNSSFKPVISHWAFQSRCVMSAVQVWVWKWSCLKEWPFQKRRTQQKLEVWRREKDTISLLWKRSTYRTYADRPGFIWWGLKGCGTEWVWEKWWLIVDSKVSKWHGHVGCLSESLSTTGAVPWLGHVGCLSESWKFIT